MRMSQLDSATELQRNVRNNTADMQDSIKDLFAWGEEMNAKEISRKKSSGDASANTGSAGATPACRKLDAATEVRAGSGPCNDRSTVPGHTSTAAAHTYDHFKERWDKFDVDAAMAEIDAEPLARGVTHTPQAASIVPARIRRPHPPAQEAEFWKKKGNEFYNFGDLAKAKECYTTSLDSMATAAAHANRALTCLKLKEWKLAEADCNAALAMGSMNLKAWQRRASARKAQGDMLGYMQDLDSALRLAPESGTISSELKQALPDYLVSQGLHMPRAKKSVAVDVHPVPVAAGAAPLLPAEKFNNACANSEPIQQPFDGILCRQQEMVEIPDKSITNAIAVVDTGSPNGHPEAPILGSKPLSQLAPASVPTLEMRPHNAPVNSAEFETTWRGFKGSIQAQAAYLDLITPYMLPKIFGSAMTPGLLESIVRTALNSVLEQGHVDHSIAILDCLTQVNRFKMNWMLITRTAKAEIATVWHRCEACQQLEMWEPLLCTTRAKFSL
eukprot:jgi/Ulvmu1/1837/UM119_0056.1